MIAEVGQFSLIIALTIALSLAIFPLWGAQKKYLPVMQFSRYAAVLQFLFVGLAFLCLLQAFIHDDFSVRYVAENSNTALPLLYKISALWGAHEGSLLLWIFILSLWMIMVVGFSKSLPLTMSARVLAVMGIISVGFLSFIIFTSNPFERLYPVPENGRDLNPLLQDPGLVIHPPMLYMGYVGFSVVFSITIAALISGQLDSVWARWSRPWTIIAWIFLTLGIMLGSWWAYYELGWGGWWFWDPVENASFMPWLVGTALLHSLIVTEKRGVFKSWTILLALITFSLSLLGTFLVRSGVLVSVHAFATDPARGMFILVFLLLVIGGSMSLYALRATTMSKQTNSYFTLFSKDSFMLAGNVLLAVAAAAVLLGTLYPLLVDALKMGKISVGAPYFNTIFVPIMLPLLVLMAIAPILRWKQDNFKRVWRIITKAVWGALGVALIMLLFSIAKRDIGTILAITIAAFLMINIISGFFLAIKKVKPLTFASLMQRSPSFYGMHIAHLGVVIFVIGVAFTESMSLQKDLRMQPGEEVNVGGYRFIFEGATQSAGINYTAYVGTIKVMQDKQFITVLKPEKRVYPVRGMPMTEAGIDAGLFRDLFVALAEPLDQGAWSLRIYYKPFVRWIWFGCILMALGGIIAVWDKRYRMVVKR